MNATIMSALLNIVSVGRYDVCLLAKMSRQSSLEDVLSCRLLDSDAVFTSTLSSDLLIKASKELHEKAEWRKRDIAALRDLIVASPECINLHCCMSDPFLLRFLRARKFDYDRALQLLISYYTVRYNDAELFHRLWPSELESALKADHLYSLPNQDYHGSKIIMVDCREWDHDNTLEDGGGNAVTKLLRCLLLILEYELCDEANQVNGITIVVDLRNAAVSQAMQRTKTSALRRLINSLQDSFPFRLHAVHFVYESYMVDALSPMLRPFLSEKIRGKVHLYHGGGLAGLQRHIDREALPTHMGGTRDDVAAHSGGYYTILMECEEYFKGLSEFGFRAPPVSPHEGNCGSVGGPLGFIFNSYKRICIDGLNSS